MKFNKLATLLAVAFLFAALTTAKAQVSIGGTAGFNLQNITDDKKKIKAIIDILTTELPDSSGGLDYNKKKLNQIVISESSKVYLIKDVDEINKTEVFKPYKDLCAKIANVFAKHNKSYAYPKSLSSTLIETAHQQQYFSQHLPRLTDILGKSKKGAVTEFLEDLVFKVLS